MKKPQYIFIHHTSVSYDKNPDQFNATNNYHRKEFGLKSSLGLYIGYNYVVSKNGVVRQARQDGEQTASQYQNNMNDGRAISICLDGNFDIEEPTSEQKAAVAALLLEKMKKYGIPEENVLCHREVATYKSCPGSKLPDNIYSYFMKEENKILPWAQESVDWAQKEGLITQTDLDATQQWTLVVLHRLWNKISK